MIAFNQYPAYREGKKFILRIDPTSLNLANCSKAFEYHNLLGTVTKKKNHVTEYGQAVHIMAAQLQRGVKPLIAISEGLNYFTSLELDTDWRDEIHLHKVLHKYATKYQFDTFTPSKKLRPETDEELAARYKTLAYKGITNVDLARNEITEYGVELPFSLPLFSTDWCDVLLVGVIDGIGKLGDYRCLKDIKCTSKWSAEKFIDAYRRSVQMKVYSFVLKQMGFTPFYPPAMIDCVFLKNDTTFCELKRSMLIDFTDTEIEETMEWVRHKAMELAISLRDGKFLKNTTCCNAYQDGCTFQTLCWGSDVMKEMSKQNFRQRVYDPSKFGKPDEIAVE